jgi:hypothetical protein
LQAGSISVATGGRIDMLNMNGTFRYVQSSEVENSSGAKNDFTNLSNFGSWHLVLENGTITSFDAILNYSNKLVVNLTALMGSSLLLKNTFDLIHVELI